MTKRLLRALCVACLVLGSASAAHSQSPVSVDAFETTFQAWMKENGVDKGVLAVAHGGRLVLERGYGGRDPNERVLLASLSKAITGRCVFLLISASNLRLDSTVGDVLAPFFRQHGEPADGRIKDATVEQLLAHRGGFPEAPRDLMTPDAIALLQTKKSPATASPSELLAAALTAPLASAPGEAFRYSNIGYLMLGVIIETITGVSYETICGRQILETEGIKAPRLDAEWRAFSSFGGWRLSGTEYLAYLARTRRIWLHDGSRPPPMTGMTAPWPSWYAAGQFLAHTTPDVRIAWHTGSWGVAPDTIGMQAVRHESGASWFVWYSPRPSKDATDALLERMAAVPPRVTAWPERDLFPERGLAIPSAK